MTLSDLSNPYLTDPGGHEHYLTAEITEIGRAAENDIIITGKRVSREHARIHKDAAQTHIGRLRQRQCDLSQ